MSSSWNMKANQNDPPEITTLKKPNLISWNVAQKPASLTSVSGVYRILMKNIYDKAFMDKKIITERLLLTITSTTETKTQ